jgi:O-methyltransferase
MLDMKTIETFASLNPNMSDFDRLVHLQWALFSVFHASVIGEVVEIGCNNGFTSAFLGLVMKDQKQSHRQIHLYDSFQGLPKPSAFDAYLKEGELLATSSHVKSLLSQFELQQPFIHEGWFNDTLPDCLPDSIAFAYIDADFYQPTKHALESVYPRMKKEGLIIVDDYADTEKNPRAWNTLSGVKRACDEFTQSNPEQFHVLCATNDLAFGLLSKE